MTSLEESLSALVDGECTSRELETALAACRSRPDLLRRYSRHWIAHEAHCGRRVHPHAEEICAGVMRGIDSSVAPEPVRRRFARRMTATPRRHWRMAGGLALAASLGAVVVFTTYRSAGPAAGGVGVTQSVVADAGMSGTPEAPDSFAMADAAARTVRWSRIDPQASGVLDEYLMQRAPQYGVGRLTHVTDGDYSGYYVPGIASEVRYSPVREAPR